jgi:hypothetical protein
LTAEQIAISRAGAIVILEVPFDRRARWGRMVGNAETLDDIPEPWRGKIAEQIEASSSESRTP